MIMLVRFFCVVLFLVLSAAAVAAGQSNDGENLIVVGGNSAYPPYEYIDKDGKPAGFVVDLTHEIAKVMGFEVRIVLGESWTDMRTALEQGEIDILQGISYSEERDKILDFSPPHSYISHSIFAHKHAKPVHSLEELRGHDVVLLGRGIMHDSFAQSGIQINVVPAATIAEALKMLASGRYDYAVLATLPARYTLDALGIDDVTIVTRGIDTKKYCYAVKEGNQAVIGLFSEGLSRLKRSGRYKELQDKWLPTSETNPWLAQHGLIIVGFLALGLIASIVWSRMLKRQVALRTAALQTEVEKRKRAAEELKLQQQQLVQADKMAALGVLVSGMAHEINNPNGLISLNLPTIAEVIRDADPILQRHYHQHGDFAMGGLAYSKMRREVPLMLDEMQDAARRIRRIVEDLKHFSRRSDANFDELVDLNTVVQTSMRLVDNSLRKATNNYNVRYEGDLPPVRGNSQRLEQVVVNLILNASQALEDPDKGIFVSTAYDAGRRGVSVQVADEGAGIPPEHLSRLTDPFFTTKRETGGTGLGLAISDGIVREHGGTMRFESIAGKGTTVIVTLPAAVQEVKE
ncbi:MAG TPA: transporter substrate-binding domain-containing protein [Dissulfurispiraceae bacterium]|nr:transporter substrate-binding domain-containing protein [Dissulfurispiraceae bacterium]